VARRPGGTFRHLPLVVEVRHESWDTAKLLAGLMERGVGFANIDQPLYPDAISPSAGATARQAYVRIHGWNYCDRWRSSATSHERYDYLYTAEELRPGADPIRDVDADPSSDDAFVITNNHYRGRALANARMLRAMGSEAALPAPPPIVDAFADELREFAIATDPEEAGRRGA
jgi:uncharacterized protein YecE (DUF72 family)